MRFLDRVDDRRQQQWSRRDANLTRFGDKRSMALAQLFPHRLDCFDVVLRRGLPAAQVCDIWGAKARISHDFSVVVQRPPVIYHYSLAKNMWICSTPLCNEEDEEDELPDSRVFCPRCGYTNPALGLPGGMRHPDILANAVFDGDLDKIGACLQILTVETPENLKLQQIMGLCRPSGRKSGDDDDIRDDPIWCGRISIESHEMKNHRMKIGNRQITIPRMLVPLVMLVEAKMYHSADYFYSNRFTDIGPKANLQMLTYLHESGVTIISGGSQNMLHLLMAGTVQDMHPFARLIEFVIANGYLDALQKRFPWNDGTPSPDVFDVEDDDGKMCLARLSEDRKQVHFLAYQEDCAFGSRRVAKAWTETPIPIGTSVYEVAANLDAPRRNILLPAIQRGMVAFGSRRGMITRACSLFLGSSVAKLVSGFAGFR